MDPDFANWTAEPFVPSSCSLRPIDRATTHARARKGAPGKARACWDLRWTVDGRRFFRRWERARDADAFAADLRRGQAMQ